ncbi:unknown [Firmicutes bacterium CAG:631]|nr:unknown [Firmicutes bacterium CAG:631]
MVLLLYYAQENGNKIEMLEEMNQTVFRLQEDAVQIGLNIQIKKLESFSMIPLLLSAIIIILFSLFIFQTIGVENLV